MLMPKFEAAFARTDEAFNNSLQALPAKFHAVGELLSGYGGTTFDEGLYRIFTVDEAIEWTANLGEFFGADAADSIAFGSDWQGNLFSLREGASPSVLLHQPGTGEIYEVAETLELFHEIELVNHREEALSDNLWKDWRLQNPGPDRSHCIGYKLPIFLGGEVYVENLVLAEKKLYWDVLGQLWNQVRDLPDGTLVSEIQLQYLN